MWITLVIVLLVVLKYFEVSYVAALSWYWIGGLVAVAFLWFEYFERIFGLDKQRQHEHFEKLRQNRLKRTFGKANRKK